MGAVTGRFRAAPFPKPETVAALGKVMLAVMELGWVRWESRLRRGQQLAHGRKGSKANLELGTDRGAKKLHPPRG